MAGVLRVRRALATAGRTQAFTRFVDLLERLDRWRPDLLPVLAYHRVADVDERRDLYPGLIDASPREFEEQMGLLAARYHVISLEELLEVRQGRHRVPPRSVMVTFDDAYRDFADHAWPTMRRHGIPVTLFVPTGYPDRPGQPFWWDRLFHALSATARTSPVSSPCGPLLLTTGENRLQAYRALRAHVKTLAHAEAMHVVDRIVEQLDVPPAGPAVLTWNELRRLASEGVELASHTRWHPLLNRVSAQEARAEIVGSAEDLERELGRVPPVFAYPSGAYSAAAEKALKEAGFSVAFAVSRWGSNDLRRPQPEWLRLRRILVGRRSTLALLRARLLPSVAKLDALRELLAG